MKRTSKKSVAEAVRKHIKRHHPDGATLEVIDSGIRKKQYWWEVPIRPSKEPKRRYAYYEALADVEDVVAHKQKVDVFLVPTNGGNA